MQHVSQTTILENDATIARATSHALEQQGASAVLRVQVTEAGNEVTTLDLPASAVPLIKAMLKEIGAGRAVTVLGDNTEITTQQAAELLNVSRPYLVGLIDKGVLAARMIGPRRRLMLADVLVYRAETKAKRREALREMAAIDQELGLR
jgi:excisionase family DNA binding protein